jgi:hypothetical protein
MRLASVFWNATYNTDLVPERAGDEPVARLTLVFSTKRRDRNNTAILRNTSTGSAFGH